MTARALTRVTITLATAVAVSAGLSAGQEASAPVVVTTAFRVNPLVLELTAEPGTSVPFEIDVQARERRQRIDVSPVTFAQNEEGGIHPAEGDPTAHGTIEIDARSRRLNLGAGEVAKVRGRARVERGGPPLLVFGLKLTEAVAEPASPPSIGATRGVLQVRLSYVVRVEVRVSSATVARSSALRVVAIELVDREGRAAVRAIVENPTDMTIEVEGRCQLRREGRRAGPGFALVLPVNAGKAGPARVTARILPGARVRLEELVPASLAPGHYVVSTILSGAGAALVNAEAEVEVPPDAFPAQALAFGRPIGDVLVSPAQVELSLRRGAPRMVPLVLEGTGSATVDVSVEAEGADWLQVRPVAAEVAPGRSRRIVLSVRADPALAGPRYGVLRVRVTPRDGGPTREERLPVALVVGDPAPARLVLVDGPALAAGEEGPVLALTVANAGGLHAPVAATLTITDASGRRVADLGAGHGAWLLPGHETRLVFPLPNPGPGQYHLTSRVRGGESSSPLEVALDWVP